jgi:4-aminobutyrate aminotransferase-like enzyme/Ser/Thr protein kinase RdoA (MazF antagonist)
VIAQAAELPADPLAEAPPALAPDEAADVAERVFGVAGEATRLDSERDANFRVEGDGAAWVLKVYNPAEADAVVEMQTRAMLHVAQTDPELPVPRVLRARDGDLHGHVELDGRRHAVHLIEFLPGDRAEPETFDLDALRHYGASVARVGRALRGFFHPAADRALLWDMRHTARLRPLLAAIEDAEERALLTRGLDRVEAMLLPALPALRAQVIHNDLTYDNVLVDGSRRVTAVVDFGDTTHAPLLCDLGVALSAFCTVDGLFDRVEAFVRGYGDVTPLEEWEAALVGDAVCARLLASALIAAWRVRSYPENADYITAFGPRTFEVLELLDELGPDEARRRFARAVAPAVLSVAIPADGASTEELLDRRGRAFGPAMTPPTYSRPLHFVRGEGVWLVDADGRRYLDAYNNVPSVGHSHPRVVAALSAQARLLNTNTRYLHETALELAERLIATMPPAVDTCLFLNSGSEANELAWRFASTVTEGTGALVTSWSYHGITAVATDLSSSEWGDARPVYVETVAAPDTSPRPDVAAAVRSLDARGHRPAALFVDSAHTSSGIYPDDAGEWLAAAAEGVRAAGGFLVADEVQAGFGRLGSRMWSFEGAGVEPDFVTLGKPMGNGHPVAAVLMRREIAERFARRGPPFFSTFGGNPVACAAALAVLDVIEEERLLESARVVGDELRAGLEALRERHELVGAVRGSGLLAGVELVDDRPTGAPASDAARRVFDGLRERGVLIGVTGPGGNVLKIRPPMCFRRDHADLLLGALDETLAEVAK